MLTTALLTAESCKSQTSSLAQELNDVQHDRCNDCGIDTVEDNDFVAGIDHVEGREPIEVAFCEFDLLPEPSCTRLPADRAPGSH